MRRLACVPEDAGEIARQIAALPFARVSQPRWESTRERLHPGACYSSRRRRTPMGFPLTRGDSDAQQYRGPRPAPAASLVLLCTAEQCSNASKVSSRRLGCPAIPDLRPPLERARREAPENTLRSCSRTSRTHAKRDCTRTKREYGPGQCPRSGSWTCNRLGSKLISSSSAEVQPQESVRGSCVWDASACRLCARQAGSPSTWGSRAFPERSRGSRRGGAWLEWGMFELGLKGK